ncbi:MAG: F0F1 ATP synthase subunit delta [Cardiobacteriaceae bacterium]|nr:F0F1 ATP synthase subunit delta [Cardiobacteriaceae bacterium]
MAHVETIARPYARAILAQAKDQKAQENWQLFLDALAGMLANTDLRRHLGRPDMMDTLTGWVEEWTKKHRKAALSQEERNFMRLLAEHDRLSVVPAIAALYARLLSQSKNICLAEIVSAKPLQNAELELIKKALVKKTGKAVELSTRIDETLLAGVYIEYDGQVIDQTMKGRMARFAHSLVD